MAKATLVAEIARAVEQYELETEHVSNIWALEELTSAHAKRVAQILMRHRLERVCRTDFPPSDDVDSVS